MRTMRPPIAHPEQGAGKTFACLDEGIPAVLLLRDKRTALAEDPDAPQSASIFKLAYNSSKGGCDTPAARAGPSTQNAQIEMIGWHSRKTYNFISPYYRAQLRVVRVWVLLNLSEKKDSIYVWDDEVVGNTSVSGARRAQPVSVGRSRQPELSDRMIREDQDCC